MTKRIIVAPGGMNAEYSARVERDYPEFRVADLGGERERLAAEGELAEICYGSLRPGELPPEVVGVVSEPQAASSSAAVRSAYLIPTESTRA